MMMMMLKQWVIWSSEQKTINRLAFTNVTQCAKSLSLYAYQTHSNNVLAQATKAYWEVEVTHRSFLTAALDCYVNVSPKTRAASVHVTNQKNHPSYEHHLTANMRCILRVSVLPSHGTRSFTAANTWNWMYHCRVRVGRAHSRVYRNSKKRNYK